MIDFKRLVELMKSDTPVFQGQYCKGVVIHCYPVEIKSVGISEIETKRGKFPVDFDSLFETEIDFLKKCLLVTDNPI